MFKQYSSSGFSDKTICDFQSQLLHKSTDELQSFKDYIVETLNKDYENRLLLNLMSYEAEDGFIYELDPRDSSRTALQVTGAKREISGAHEFVCVADTVAPKAFAIKSEEDGEHAGNDYIYILHLPFCTEIGSDSFKGLCHIIEIDAPNLAEERFIKHLAEILKRNQALLQINPTTSEMSESNRKRKSRKP